MTLQEARNEIDKIDDELLRLLLRRLEISSAIGKLKKEGNIPTFDQAREEEILNRLKVASRDKYKYIEPVFKEVLKESKAIQEKTK